MLTSDRLLIPQEMGVAGALITDCSREMFCMLAVLECFEGVAFVKSCTCHFCLEGNPRIKQ